MTRPKTIKIEDYIGVKINRLTIKEQIFDKPNSPHLRVIAICDCGNVKSYRLTHIISKETHSCGCYRNEKVSSALVKHNMTGTRTYKTWVKLKDRCNNEKDNMYYLYGARDISICDRWNVDHGGSFENFLEDMGERPEGCSLDRIDNDLGYCKQNCRWASASLQGFNQRLRKDNKSGRVGVSKKKSGNKWSAKIGYNNNRIDLGVFDSFEEACNARSIAELYYFGFTKG